MTTPYRFIQKGPFIMRIPFLKFLIGLTPVMLMAAPVMAQTQQKSTGPVGTWVLIPLMFIVMWFMMIRPEQKKQKERLKMIAAMKKGDRVMMSGGMYGIVHNVKEKTVMVKIADNTVVEFEKSAVTMIPGAETAPAEKAEPAEKDKK